MGPNGPVRVHLVCTLSELRGDLETLKFENHCCSNFNLTLIIDRSRRPRPRVLRPGYCCQVAQAFLQCPLCAQPPTWIHSLTRASLACFSLTSSTIHCLRKIICTQCDSRHSSRQPGSNQLIRKHLFSQPSMEKSTRSPSMLVKAFGATVHFFAMQNGLHYAFEGYIHNIKITTTVEANSYRCQEGCVS